jgi:predicted dehydrogenase
MMKTRYAQVGLGQRSEMYHEALLTRYADSSELVGFCDSNEGRLALRVAWARQCGVDVPGYLDADFDRMIAETQPDCVIVTTNDSIHDEYICRAMELGCDVITEKPMTVDADKCQRIIDMQQRTGKTCRVTFNYRYTPHRTQIKEILMSGMIGEVLSVDFHWLLDTRHGADYFRRWHRSKENSGGLMVHKATHHFDLVNWWLDSVPESVFASGHRRFYTPAQAEVYGLSNRSERCMECAEQVKCPFYLDLNQYDKLRSLYLNNEQHDGYYRDRCVFSAEMDIEDSMNVIVNYVSGAKMTYSLNAYMPWEGYIIAFNGSKGRLEHKSQESLYVTGDSSTLGAIKKEGTTIHIFPHFKPAYAIDVWTGKGGHGGGDAAVLEAMFKPDASDDRYQRVADHRSGAYSILTGIAANQSMATGALVHIADLVHGL